MVHLAIFASGGGSNARKIMERFKDSKEIQVAMILSNKNNAGVLEIAAEFDVPTRVFDKKTFYETEEIKSILQSLNVEWIVLAGFLWLIPDYLVKAFPRKIVNIHPALLPKFGGKGMYGMHVHQAVKDAGESKSGMTIHLVNEQYDEGDVLFQESCSLEPEDSAAEIARKVLALEHRYYPQIIEQLILTAR